MAAPARPDGPGHRGQKRGNARSRCRVRRAKCCGGSGDQNVQEGRWGRPCRAIPCLVRAGTTGARVVFPGSHCAWGNSPYRPKKAPHVRVPATC
jgi:hypothetical protein